MKSKTFAENLLESGNVILHLILGAGIAMLFLKWERDWIGQILGIGIAIPFGVCGLLEYGQGLIPGVKRNIYDVFVGTIAGLITVLIYLIIYGFKWGADIGPQEPKTIWQHIGWTLIAISVVVWLVKQVINKYK